MWERDMIKRWNVQIGVPAETDLEGYNDPGNCGTLAIQDIYKRSPQVDAFRDECAPGKKKSAKVGS